MRVTGEDGKPTSLPDIPRQKIGTCTYRAETTIITVDQRMAVRRLLTEAGVPFENGQEAFALSALVDRLQTAAQQSGGQAPAPEPDFVPDLPKYKSLAGNDLLAALAENAASLRDKLKSWQAAFSKIGTRLPNWNLAERLIWLGASELAANIEDIRSGRRLLADPDPVPPLISAAAQALRAKINAAHGAWDAAWTKGEGRLASAETWGHLTPDQKHTVRQESGLLIVAKPAVDTPQAIGDALAQRGLSEWESMIKALPTRIDDALAAAAAQLEPKARPLNLPGALLKSEPELDDWLTKVRTKIIEALSDGPVIPKV